MSQEEKATYSALLSGVIIFAWYFWRIAYLFNQGRFDAPDAMAVLGKTILFMVVGGIVVNILMMIVMTVLFATITKDAKPRFFVDERDRLIELRALRVSYYLFGAGFIASMIFMALGYSALVVFNLIVGAMMVATFSEGLIKLFIYRRGF